MGVSRMGRFGLGLATVGLAAGLACGSANAATVSVEAPAVVAVQRQAPASLHNLQAPAAVPQKDVLNLMPTYDTTPWVVFTGNGRWLFWTTCNYEKRQWQYWGYWRVVTIEEWSEFC